MPLEFHRSNQNVLRSTSFRHNVTKYDRGLGLHPVVKKDIMYFRGAPYNREELPQEMRHHADVLAEAGFEHLIPLLDRELMSETLRNLELNFTEVLRIHRPSSQPKRDPRELGKMRAELQRYMLDDGLIGLFSAVRIYPPEALSGLTGMSGNALEVTDIGRVIQSIKRSHPHLQLLMHAGRARDTTRTRPERFQWETLPATAMRIFNLRDLFAGEKIWSANVRLHPPENDFDFIVFTPDENITLQRIQRGIEEIFYNKNGGWVEEKQSSRRTGFIRLDFGVTGRMIRDHFNLANITKRVPLGHFFGPSFRGQYNMHNPLLPFLMESARVDMPILLIPYQNTIWGIALDFFGGFNDVQRHRLNEQTWLNYYYRLMVYHFPDQTFPRDDPQQLLFAFGYMMRNCSWFWGLPAISASRKSPVLESDLEPSRYHIRAKGGNLTERRTMAEMILNRLPEPSGDPFFQRIGVDAKDPSRKGLHKQTQEWLTENVVRFLHNVGTNERSLLGSTRQRLESGVSLLEDIAQAFDADTIATALRMMPAGECYTQQRSFFELNLFGFGIIDKQGIFARLHEFWDRYPEAKEKFVNKILMLANLRSLEAEKNRLSRENYRITHVNASIDTVALRESNQKIDEINDQIDKIVVDNPGLRKESDTEKGRTFLFDYLFEIAEKDPRRVLGLLQPVWCSEEEWQRMTNNKDTIKRLIELDDRFDELVEKPEIKQIYRRRILSILNCNQPLTILQVFKRYIDYYTRGTNPKTSHIFRLFIPLMNNMLKHHEIQGIGPIYVSRKDRASKLPFRWFCLPEVAETYGADPSYQTIEGAVKIKLRDHPYEQVNVLADELGFTYDQIRDALDALEARHEVVYKKIEPDGYYKYRLS